MNPALCTVYTSSRLAYYTPDDENSVTLHFTDGKTATADVIIGADGVRSAVRSSMFAAKQVERQKIEPKWCGVVVYRTLIKSELLKKDQRVRKFAEEPMMVRILSLSSACQDVS